jgi:DNA-binding NarL/FixJ family response regulator
METAHPRTTPQQIRVFLVEDSKAIRDRLVELLGGIENVNIVGEAGTQAEAVSGIYRTHPDSVVLDIQLPEGSGIGVLREIHSHVPEIKFIVLTNHASTQYRKICMTAGASHFLDKSSEFGDVRKILQETEVRAIPQRMHTAL